MNDGNLDVCILVKVPVRMPLICAISALRVAAPHDLRPPEARQSVLMAVDELKRRFPDGFPKLDPIEVRVLSAWGVGML